MSLYPFQINGVRFMKDVLTHRSGVFLADEMGLGKTIQALYLMKGLDRVNNGLRYLIVCPKSLTTVWKTQAEKWIGKQINIFKKGVPIEGSLIINYDIAAANIDSLLAAQFHILICDEAHRLKTLSAKRTKAVYRISKDIRTRNGKVILLSGTPVLNAPIELYAPLCILGNTFSMNQEQFARRYCNRKLVSRFGRRFYDDTGISNPEELKKQLSVLMLRRMKAEVLKELPPVIKQIVLFPSEKKMSKTTTAITSQINELSDIGKMKVSNRELFSEFITLRKEQAIEKIPLCIEHIKDVLTEKQKVVVFAHHVEVQKRLLSELSEYNPVCIAGDTKDSVRKDNVNKFQTDPAVRVIIVSMMAGGEGITLTAADTCIFVEIDYTPAVIEQCIARLHRITQTQTVQAVFLFQEGSIDGHIVNLVVKKENIINQVFEK